MRNATVIFAAAAALASTSASAEGFAEARVGIAGASDYTTETIGVAVGYDGDVGSKVFIGAELTADTNASFDVPVYGANLRLGAKTSDNGKLYLTGGIARYRDDAVIYSSTLGFGQTFSGWYTDTVAGAGYAHKIGSSARISVQYQRYVDTGFNRGAVGIGFEF
jgi:hypothetical protein